MAENWFLQLPNVIIIDIISRLPPRSICICKCVCKSLFYLTSKNYGEFSKLDFSRSHPEELIFQFHDNINASKTLHLLHSSDQKLVHAFQDIQITSKFFLYSSHTVKNSCCGLLYLIDSLRVRSSIVTNPITGEYIVLPREEKRVCNLASWLGFCSKSNQFKVLRIVGSSIASQIYELGSNSWREVETAPYIPQTQVAHSLNGSLYWRRYDKICSFCFENEKFGNIPFPIGFTKYQDGLLYDMNIGMLRNCLSLCDITSDQQKFDVWVMKEYGVRESWSKEYVVNIGAVAKSLGRKGKFQMVKYLSNGKILMIPENKSELVCFDPMHDTIRCLNLEYNGLLKNAKCRVIVYGPTLVSLKDVIKYSNVNVLTVKSRDIELSAQGESENVKIVEYCRIELSG